jgi:hypothetical protein
MARKVRMLLALRCPPTPTALSVLNPGSSNFGLDKRRLEGAPNWRRDCERSPQNAKKILNSGNEPKDLLKRKKLSVFGWKNELVFECEKRRFEGKNRCQVTGFRGWGPGMTGEGLARVKPRRRQKW